MSYAERIKNSPNPQLAMQVLAEGIDEVLSHLAVPAQQDPWGSWNVDTGAQPTSPTASASTTNGPVTQRPVVDNAAAIAAVQEALNTTTDPDDRIALEARLRLLTDEGASIDVGAPTGRMVIEQDLGDQVVMTLPPPSPERQAARAGFADRHKLWSYSVLDAEEFQDAFVKGGPLWLYHTARDEVMGMPYEWRQWLIADINLDSPRTAQEVGRDLLKDEGTGNKAVALGTLGVDDE